MLLTEQDVRRLIKHLLARAECSSSVKQGMECPCLVHDLYSILPLKPMVPAGCVRSDEGGQRPRQDIGSYMLCPAEQGHGMRGCPLPDSAHSMYPEGLRKGCLRHPEASHACAATVSTLAISISMDNNLTSKHLQINMQLSSWAGIRTQCKRHLHQHADLYTLLLNRHRTQQCPSGTGTQQPTPKLIQGCVTLITTSQFGQVRANRSRQHHDQSIQA